MANSRITFAQVLSAADRPMRQKPAAAITKPATRVKPLCIVSTCVAPVNHKARATSNTLPMCVNVVANPSSTG